MNRLDFCNTVCFCNTSVRFFFSYFPSRFAFPHEPAGCCPPDPLSFPFGLSSTSSTECFKKAPHDTPCCCVIYCHSKDFMVQATRLCNLICNMLQGHRYLEPPILGVQSRLGARRRHPDSPLPEPTPPTVSWVMTTGVWNEFGPKFHPPPLFFFRLLSSPWMWTCPTQGSLFAAE